MISNEDLINMCRKLAHKYNRPNDFDDIVSEGAIVCLELRAEDPEVHPAKLYREANRAMHDYINLSLQPVSIPKSWTARDVARGGSGESDNQSYSETGIDWLRNIMSSDHVSYDDFISSIPDHAEEYEKLDYESYILTVAEQYLSLEEWRILRLRFWEDMSQSEVAEVLGLNQSTVSRREEQALKHLCNNL
jgi:RNA polymerase sigma factor (sigma-70 family)